MYSIWRLLHWSKFVQNAEKLKGPFPAACTKGISKEAGEEKVQSTMFSLVIQGEAKNVSVLHPKHEKKTFLHQMDIDFSFIMDLLT